jgi:hypothetical protein
MAAIGRLSAVDDAHAQHSMSEKSSSRQGPESAITPALVGQRLIMIER